MGTLDGRVAMVTGAGRGLGCATTLLFAREGADVAAVDIDAAAAKETTERAMAFGRRAVEIAADLADASAARRAAEESVERLGRLDVLVNAAGVLDIEPLRDVSEAGWDRAFAVKRGLRPRSSRGEASEGGRAPLRGN